MNLKTLFKKNQFEPSLRAKWQVWNSEMQLSSRTLLPATAFQRSPVREPCSQAPEPTAEKRKVWPGADAMMLRLPGASSPKWRMISFNSPEAPTFCWVRHSLPPPDSPRPPCQQTTAHCTLHTAHTPDGLYPECTTPHGLCADPENKASLFLRWQF